MEEQSIDYGFFNGQFSCSLYSCVGQKQLGNNTGGTEQNNTELTILGNKAPTYLLSKRCRFSYILPSSKTVQQGLLLHKM